MKSFKKLSLSLALAAPTLAFASMGSDLIINGSFEESPVATSGGSYCYLNTAPFQCSASIDGWNGVLPLMTSTSGPWSATPNTASDLFQAGLQQNSFVQQSVYVAAPGQYTLTWSDSGRTGYGTENYQVSFGGVVLATRTTFGGQAWATHSVTFDAAYGKQTLRFQGLTTGVDSTAFIDNIGMTAAVPEPTTWALMAAGLFAVGTVARKRRA